MNRSAMKRARKKPPTAVEARHIARVAAMPCLLLTHPVYGWFCEGMRTTVHHVSSTIHGGRISRSNQRIVPLCQGHHLIQFGPKDSVEALSHRGFYREYDIDLLAVADKLWQESVALETGLYIAQEAANG